jgi:hypothetical protein
VQRFLTRIVIIAVGLVVITVLALIWIMGGKWLFARKDGTITNITFTQKGSCTLRSWNTWSSDCGVGGMPLYEPRCGHWIGEQSYTDASKACHTGKDCCSKICVVNGGIVETEKWTTPTANPTPDQSGRIMLTGYKIPIENIKIPDGSIGTCARNESDEIFSYGFFVDDEGKLFWSPRLIR